jgi:hypothetical protein
MADRASKGAAAGLGSSDGGRPASSASGGTNAASVRVEAAVGVGEGAAGPVAEEAA